MNLLTRLSLGLTFGRAAAEGDIAQGGPGLALCSDYPEFIEYSNHEPRPMPPMKTSRPTLLFAGLLTLGVCSIASAQNASPGMPGPRRPNLISPPTLVPVEALSTNYQVTFSGASEGKPLGELSMLTCSPEISVNGPLNAGQTPTTFMVEGSLTEKEGELLFRYNIGFSVPITPPNGNGQGHQSISYQQHTTQGMLRMKAGTPYEVLKSGGVVYTIMIAPAPTK
jgi:hypothetical protein